MSMVDTGGREGSDNQMRGRRGLPPRVPLPSSDNGAANYQQQLARAVRQLAEEQRVLRHAIAIGVGTLDLLVYEHDRQALDPTKGTFTMNLVPQTAQQELIKGLFCAITVPSLVASPTITVTNAWAQLGDQQINLNAVLNSDAGTGGALPGEYAYILGSESTRQINLVCSANWPSGAYVSFSLFGTVIPSQMGGVLH